jgi:hypothetical protein
MDRATAERLAAWIRERITFEGSRDMTEVEVFESNDGFQGPGRLDWRAVRFTRSAEAGPRVRLTRRSIASLDSHR